MATPPLATGRLQVPRAGDGLESRLLPAADCTHHWDASRYLSDELMQQRINKYASLPTGIVPALRDLVAADKVSQSAVGTQTPQGRCVHDAAQAPKRVSNRSRS